MASEVKVLIGVFLVLASLLREALLAEFPGEGVAPPSPPTPCCFPSSFQATVADMRSAATGNMRLFEVYRDWEKRLQVQRVLEFAPPGQTTAVMTMIMDFQNAVHHMVSASGDCQSQPLDYAMLEPCMPETAQYLGQTYLGFGGDTTNFQTWSFTRTDKGRNITMTVGVTASDCVPVVETIVGTLGLS
ncbi:hypothetical protein BaRGS_00031990 [Batillaria attramentaria]|uniref:Uncharacterized protein n=1 Tax=Batillaria attramentaria TaxID=370345 RepID=A0ABD0JPL4_9CAEN